MKKSKELHTTNMAKRLLGIPITEKSSTQSSTVYVPCQDDLTDHYRNPALLTSFSKVKSSVGAVGEWETVQEEQQHEKVESNQSLVESNQSLVESNEFNQSHKDQDVHDKILEFSRSVLHSTLENDVLNEKEAKVSTGEEDVSIKKRVIKGKKNFKR